MQFVNDDMDDLYRRAAEEYPLKTDGSDWNKVVDKMQNDAGRKTLGKIGKRPSYFLMLVLIPLLLICTTYITNEAGNNTSRQINNETNLVPQSIPLKKEKQSKPDEGQSAKTITSNGTDQPINNYISEVRKSIANRNDNYYDETNISRQAKIIADKLHQQTNTKGNGIENGEDNLNNNYGVANNEKKGIDLINHSSSNNREVQAPLDTVATSHMTEQQHEINKNGEKIKEENPGESPSTQTGVKKNQKKNLKQPQKNFYFGLMAGPDFSMVKSTKINGTGYTFGLLAGFNFNKKLALESGIMWDNKKYQADGKYFNTQKLNWPNVTIYNLSGYCNMFEIPLTIRYNVSANSQRTWFANAGLSSYIMKKENYDYNYARYGQYQKGNKVYKNTTANWLSVAHLSVGLQKKLGAIGDFRIEPYVKLPVNGVGIGSMPLRSTGIYVGISRSIR